MLGFVLTKVLAFLRTQGPWQSFIFCNWSQEESDFEVLEEIVVDLAILKIATSPVSDDSLDKKVRLRPYEARIYFLRNKVDHHTYNQKSSLEEDSAGIKSSYSQRANQTPSV